jgi:hypothetical protein
MVVEVSVEPPVSIELGGVHLTQERVVFFK